MNTKVSPPPSFSELLSVGDVESARKLAEQRIEAMPADPEARAALARIALLDLDGELAQAHLDQAAHSNSPGMRLALAGMAALEGEDEKALALFERALADEGSTIEARFGQGISLARLERLDEALQALRAAVAGAPESGHLRYHLGRCELEAGDASAGLVSLGKAVELDPYYADAWAALARAISVTGQKKRAKEIIAQGLALHPDHSTLLTELANIEMSSGQIEAGLEVLEQVAADNPNDPFAAANEAQRRIAKGQASSAIEFALQKRADGVWASCLASALATAYEVEGDFEAALVAWADATSLDESDWRAPNNFGLLLSAVAETEQLPMAIEALETAHHRAKGQLEPLLNLALVHARMDHREAATELARYIAGQSLEPNHPVQAQATRLLASLGGSIEPSRTVRD